MALLTDSGPQAHTHSAETLVPDQSRAERTRSWEVADFPVPQGREEDWRFTPVGRLAELFTDEGGSATLSVEHDLPQGVTRTQVPAAEARTAGVPLPADRAAAVAASGDSVVVIDVPAEAELAEPVRVHLTGEAGEPVRAHHLVRVGAFAKATLVVEHSGTAEYTELLSVIAGDSAQLTIVSLQDWEDDAQHLGQHQAHVGHGPHVAAGDDEAVARRPGQIGNHVGFGFDDMDRRHSRPLLLQGHGKTS